MDKLTTRKEYDETKARVEELINEATSKGLLEPDMDNAYTQEIAALSRVMAAYEDEFRPAGCSPIADIPSDFRQSAASSVEHP